MIIPGYQLGREISVGDFCSAYNALDIANNKTVTIKVFKKSVTENKAFCQHFKAVTDNLVNKTIGILVPVKVVVSTADTCYLITDYFPSSQQQEDMPEGFTANEVLQFGQNLASTLDLLHSMGIVHGAVQRSNLYFPEPDHVILGVGAFHRTMPGNQDAAFPATTFEESSYRPPEAINQLNAQSDFYALAVVIYELIFGKKPFIADTIEQLQPLKLSMSFSISDSRLEPLLPLFESMLKANPVERISNSEDFYIAAKQCGFTLNRPDYSITEGDGFVANEQEKIQLSSPSSSIINKIILPVVVLMALGGLVFLLLPGPQPRDTINEKLPELTRSEQQSIPEEQPVAENKKTNPAELMYQQAQQLVSSNNYRAAQTTINDAIKQDPVHQAAKQLKSKIDHEVNVRAIILKAETLVTEGKLAKPAGDNALETYRTLSNLLPDHDDRLKRGLEKIADEYYSRAQKAVTDKQFDSARSFIFSGLQVLPDFKRLKDLEQTILLQEKAIQQQQAKLEDERIKRQAQLKAEKERQARLEKARAAEMQAVRKQAELAQREQARQQEIKTLFDRANALLESELLSLASLSNAKKIYDQLLSIDKTDSRVSALFKDIMVTYGILANSQKNKAEYQLSLQTIELGLAVDKNNLNLLQIRNEIKEIRLSAQQQKKKLPVIGTF